jgi:hypothetical protein
LRSTRSKASPTRCLPPSTRQPYRRRVSWPGKSTGPGVNSTRGARAVLQHDGAASRKSRARNLVPSNWESRGVYLGMAWRPIGIEAGTIHAMLPAVRNAGKQEPSDLLSVLCALDATESVIHRHCPIGTRIVQLLPFAERLIVLEDYYRFPHGTSNLYCLDTTLNPVWSQSYPATRTFTLIPSFQQRLDRSAPPGRASHARSTQTQAVLRIEC